MQDSILASSSSSTDDKSLLLRTMREREEFVRVQNGISQRTGLPPSNQLNTVHLVPALRARDAEPGETWSLARLFSYSRGGTPKE